MLRQTHNVVIVHHLRDWAEADAFRARMEELYAREHGGEKFGDHLATTLYPLANNVWITNNIITFTQQYLIMWSHGKRPDLFDNIRAGFARKKAQAAEPKKPGGK